MSISFSRCGSNENSMKTLRPIENPLIVQHEPDFEAVPHFTGISPAISAGLKKYMDYEYGAFG